MTPRLASTISPTRDEELPRALRLIRSIEPVPHRVFPIPCLDLLAGVRYVDPLTRVLHANR